MAKRTWNKQTAQDRIDARLAEVKAPLHRIIWSEHDWAERPEDLDDRAATARYFRDFDDWLEAERELKSRRSS